MKVRIDPHTLTRARERGATEDEIRDVVQSGDPVTAKHGRQGRAKVFRFAQKRNGIFYTQKKVEVYFVEEDGIMTTVTEYVFYGSLRK